MTYSIGNPGQKWGDNEKKQWFNQQTIKRSYKEEVVEPINKIASKLSNLVITEQYGFLSIDEKRYPLFVFKSKHWQDNNSTVLVTGGVHGYETSGVKGALLFVQTKLANYADKFNFVVVPCLSPWGYETINRWNPLAIDPNRSFYENSPAEESAKLMAYMQQQKISPICHVDLHETTDTDNSEFRPALSARDAIEQKSWNIPDGFYGVGDTGNPQPKFQKAIIDSVKLVTHIAPADHNNELIGVPIEQLGVINYDKKKLGLCGGFTNAQFVSTTEVYPDSPLVDDENCNQAQVAAITGALDYLIEHQL